MPSSPIRKKLPHYPKGWKSLQKVIIPDSKTSHFYSVWYEEQGGCEKGDWYATLMCCYIHDRPAICDSWHEVTDLEEEHHDILCTIETVFGISFHKSIWVNCSDEIKVLEETLTIRKIGSGPVAIGKGETWDGE